MIQKQVLKQVAIVGAAALVFLHRASGAVEKDDLLSIHDYWSVRLLNIEKKVELRSNFLKKLSSLNARVSPDSSDTGVEEDNNSNPEMEEKLSMGQQHLSDIAEHLAYLNEKIQAILDIIHSLEDLQKNSYTPCCAYNKNKQDKNKAAIKADLHTLKKLFIPALDNSTSLIEKINKYDLHMAEVVEEQSRAANKCSTLHDLTLFKLAKSNKVVAADIIYTLSDIAPSKLDSELELIIFVMHRNLINHIPYSNIKLFMYAVRDDVVNRSIDPLISADSRLYLLSDRYNPVYQPKSSVLDLGTMNIYLTLLKKDIYRTYLSQCMHITPGEVMKIIMIEYLMTGRLLDHKNNKLFSVLGEIIENIGKPASNSKNIHKRIGIERAAQDKILDALSIVWNDYKSATSVKHINVEQFCYKNGFSFFDFFRVQKSFASIKWMYEIERYSLEPEYTVTSIDEVERQGTEPENSIPRKELTQEVHFDISYTHPMWYIYKRCEYINSFSAIDTTSSDTPFIEVCNDVFTLRPHRIRERDSDAVRTENINKCIRAWFAQCTEIISRREDNEGYNLAYDFAKYLKTSEEKTVNMKEETEWSAEANQSNPFYTVKLS
ncbi:hypothetical protein NEMIN01_0352 [Nematocida minor]|uniref:uncharacterized protein n=1 Tax=Nematocida minor TaxID=1912983 RepID=UPI00222101CC|nr:uncharacterized protein NEMIN01_0352 [Nematocida minor]KAI5189186.1 hypothetical protein NEMIN01_0352 [Nematocida minor]